MISAVVDAEQQLVRIEVVGPFVLADLVKAWREYGGSAQSGNGLAKILWDLRDAQWSAAASEFEMLNLRTSNARYEGRQNRVFAFLFASQSETAIVDIYLADLQRICVPAFFHYEKDALAWLTQYR